MRKMLGSVLVVGLLCVGFAGQAAATGSNSGDLQRITEVLRSSTPATWVFLGDSITYGGEHTHGHPTYSDLFDARVRGEWGRTSDRIVNSGVSGDTTGDALADWDSRVSQHQPTVVSIMFGMNDAIGGASGRDTYRANLTTMVDKVRASGAIPILQMQNPINGDPGSRSDFPAYMNVMREVATQEEVVLIDHNSYWGSLDITGLYSDELHPNEKGHAVFAEKLFDDLNIAAESGAFVR